MKTRLVILAFLLFSIGLGMVTTLGAFDALRQREAVIVFSNRFPHFINSPVEHIFAYVYDSGTHTWHQITHQIDERDAELGYFGAVNGILDLNEEFMFMANDAGDRASSYYWINDEDSRNYTRYELEISDPSDALSRKYVYIFRSASLQKAQNLPSYITYFPSSGGSDKVVGLSYSEEHTDAIPKHWIIPVEAGGAGLDILDRQKARVNGDHSIIGSVKLTEDNMNYKSGNISYVSGPIRISRKAVFEIKIKKVGITLTAVDISFTKQYYPYHVHHLKANKKLDSEWGIKLIRQSFDFNFNGIGMHFYNPHNHVLIDGVSDEMNRTLLLEPEYNWYLATGDPGTVVNIFQVDDVGDSQRLYYWDKTNDTTYDGTEETGYDKKSYGDAGVLFTGSNMDGSLGMPMHIHFLGANQDSIIGPTLVENLKNPLIVQPREDSYKDNIIASIPDTSQRQGLDIGIPIHVQELSGSDLTSCDITVKYDATAVQALGVTKGAMTELWDISHSIDRDSITIHLEGTTQIEGSGDLVILAFNVTGEPGTQSAISAPHMSFNERTINADVSDGILSILEPHKVTISVPDTSQEKGLAIAIPVRIDHLDDADIRSVNLNIVYNKDILNFFRLNQQNTLTANWNTADHSQNQDTLSITLSGTSPLSDDGDLIMIEFNVIGDPGNQTPLTINEVVYNNGYPIAITNNGSFQVLTPPQVMLTIPDTTGEANASFNLPIFIEDVSGLNIKSFHLALSFNSQILDAVDIETEGTLCSAWADHQIDDGAAAFEIDFNGIEPLSGSGVLLYIRFNTIGNGGDTTTVSLSDINFNNGNPTGVSNPGLFSITHTPVSVSLPDTSGIRGMIVSIPVLVGDITGRSVTAFKTLIEFNKAVLNLTSVSFDSTLSESWQNPVLRNYSTGIYISASGTQALSGSGELLYLNFYISGITNANTELSFNYFLFNEGAVSTSLTDGSFSVSGEIPRIHISVPDTSAMEEQTIKIPVNIGNITGLNIRTIRFSLGFNPMIIQAKGVDVEASISADTDSVGHTINDKGIDILVSSDQPLNGSGPLVFIEFDVVGAANTSTLIQFESMAFNDGFFPIGLPEDGLFTVLRLPKVTISIPQMSGYKGENISFPVQVSDVTGMGVSSFELELEFNGSVLHPLNIDQAGTMTENWAEGEVSIDVNHISMALAGDSSLVGLGDLVHINFEVTGEPGEESILQFNQALFNEGVPAAISVNSHFVVNEIENIVVSLPDTMVMSGTSIRLPLSTEDLTGHNITSYQTSIAYNPAVLQPVSVSNSGTLTSEWETPQLEIEDDRLVILAEGTNALIGAGTLCHIYFDVIGIDSSRSPLGFIFFTFNQGIPSSTFINGLVTIEGVIPVELAAFEAVLLESSVRLTWKTLSESNNFGFEIQKSIDLDEWSNIGFLKGNGTTAVPQYYEFDDPKMKEGTVYYRLKQIDLDGQFHISMTVEVSVKLPERLQLSQNYPNPFNSTTVIKFQVPKNSGVEISIYNILGEKMITLADQPYEAGFHQLEWAGKSSDGRTLPSGIYIYKIKVNGYVHSKKMLLLQ